MTTPELTKLVERLFPAELVAGDVATTAFNHEEWKVGKAAQTLQSRGGEVLKADRPPVMGPRWGIREMDSLSTGPAGARVLFHLSAEPQIAERLGGRG